MVQCEECKQEFISTRINQRFCSRQCSKKNWRSIPKNREKENKQRREYYKNHKEDEKQKSKDYRKKHPEQQKKWNKNRKNRYWDNRDEEIKRNKRWKELNPDEQRAYHKKHRDKLKMDVIIHYSNGTMACANPYNQHDKPYTDIRALSIDHIEGGGCKHRLSLNLKSSGFYRWLRKNNYPSGYQVLCMNCQFIKRNVEKECDKPIE